MSKDNIKAIIVDDEERARDVLENLLIRNFSQVEILSKCKDVEEAVFAINTYDPDVVFLDIEMPNYAGYELVSFFEEVNFDIVFVTAYDDYAIKAFEVSAVDYLLKPIEVERLRTAVERIIENKEKQIASEQLQLLQESLQETSVQKIMVSYQGGQRPINTLDIIAIEAQESYSYIYLITSEKLMVSKNLRHFEKVLSDNPEFFRCHKSWLINSGFVENFSKTRLEISLKNGLVAKLSKYKKPEFEAELLK